jgi:hypothetical protein
MQQFILVKAHFHSGGDLPWEGKTISFAV